MSTIVVVDSSAVDRELTTSFLGERGFEVLAAAGGAEGLALCRDVDPDVIVLDVTLPGTDGLRVLDAVRVDPALKDTPVVIMADAGSADLAAEGIERGADDYVRKPSHVELLARIETVLRRRTAAHRLERRAAQLATTASKDVVTELPNRVLLEEELGRLIALSRRHHRPLCVALVDVDGYSRLIEQHGAEVGGDVLRRVGRALTQRLRASDFVGRWGSDEFLLLLPDTPAEGAARVADDVRANVEAGDSPTVSVGWAHWDGGSGMQLIARAEEALREAKGTGPNSVRGG